MNRVAVVVFAVAVVSSAVAAEPTNALSQAAVETQGRYLSATRREGEVGGQRKLLLELNTLHQGRAEAARAAGQQELARWEEDCAREYAARAARLEKDLAEVTKERVALEPALPAGNLAASESAIYLAKIQERSSDAQQQLAALADVSALYLSQLATNNTPEHITRVSDQLESHRFEERALRRELDNLELRRLEFRALRPQP